MALLGASPRTALRREPLGRHGARIAPLRESRSSYPARNVVAHAPRAATRRSGASTSRSARTTTTSAPDDRRSLTIRLRAQPPLPARAAPTIGAAGRRPTSAGRSTPPSPRSAHGPTRPGPAGLDLQRRRRRRLRQRQRAGDRPELRRPEPPRRSGRCSSSGTWARRRASTARSSSPIIRPCRGIRSWPSSTSTWWAGATPGSDRTDQGRRDDPRRPGLPPADRLPSALDRAGRPGRDGEHEDQHGLNFDYAMDANGHPQNIYCRSDHYEYARYGIPIVFFTTGGHADYHQVTDEPQYIDYDQMARVARFVADIADPRWPTWTIGWWWTSRSRIRTGSAGSRAFRVEPAGRGARFRAPSRLPPPRSPLPQNVAAQGTGDNHRLHRLHRRT